MSCNAKGGRSGWSLVRKPEVGQFFTNSSCGKPDGRTLVGASFGSRLSVFSW